MAVASSFAFVSCQPPPQARYGSRHKDGFNVKNILELGSAMFGKMASSSPKSVALKRRRDKLMAKGEVSQKESEITAKKEVQKRPLFPLLDLYDIICRGPLRKKVGFTEDEVAQTIDEWLTLGVKLSRQLQFDEFSLSDSEKARIYHYYVPVFLWCKRELEIHSSKFKEGEEVPALVIGISAPQGCGKTTIVYSLEYLFNSLGRRAAAISIDDFYLTAAGQAELAHANPGNSLLEMRGNAGSHDLQLGTETLRALRSLTTSGTKTKLARYDKSANNGFGDRADPLKWCEIEGPVKVVLLEGWMLGFEPQDEAAVAAVDPQLVPVNKNLAAYHDAWDSMVDSWIVVQVGDPNWVFKWRLENSIVTSTVNSVRPVFQGVALYCLAGQAEVAMRADGRPGMTDKQVADFVSRYMPAYKAYLPALYSQGPKGAKKEHMLKLDINQGRNPIG